MQANQVMTSYTHSLNNDYNNNNNNKNNKKGLLLSQR